MLRRTGGRAPQVPVNMTLNGTEGRRVAEGPVTSGLSFLKTAPDYQGFVPYNARA